MCPLFLPGSGWYVLLVQEKVLRSKVGRKGERERKWKEWWSNSCYKPIFLVPFHLFFLSHSSSFLSAFFPILLLTFTPSIFLLYYFTGHNEMYRTLQQPGNAICVDIPSNMSLCHGIGYTKMRLPNLLLHDSLQEVSIFTWVRFSVSLSLSFHSVTTHMELYCAVRYSKTFFLH